MRSQTVFHPSLVLFLIPGLAVAFGCAGEPDPTADWDGAMRDSAGVVLVENHGSPLWSEEERWTLSEVLRIGTFEGEPEYQFGSISGFAPLSDGRIVITDDMAQHLRIYSPDGVHLRTVGTAGEGPKDFGSSRLSVLVGPGDTVLVMDWANMQTHVIDPSGDWLDSWKFTPQDGMRVAGWDTAPSGLIMNLLQPVQRPDIAASDTLDAVVMRDIRGRITDTLAWIPSQSTFSLRGGTQELRFYGTRPRYDLRWSGGLVVGTTDEYRLKWLDSNGDLERIVSLARDRIPMDGDERDACMNLFEAVWDKWDMSPERQSFVKSTIRWEDHYPAFRLFKHGPRGTLWVQQVRPTTALTDGEFETENAVWPWPYGSTQWDVLDAEGRYLGVAEIPGNLSRPLFYGDRLYGIWRDEMDVEYLVALEIEGLPVVE